MTGIQSINWELKWTDKESQDYKKNQFSTFEITFDDMVPFDLNVISIWNLIKFPERRSHESMVNILKFKRVNVENKLIGITKLKINGTIE